MDRAGLKELEKKFAEKERLDELINFLIHFCDAEKYYVAAEEKRGLFRRKRLYVGYKNSSRKCYLGDKEIAALLGFVADEFRTLRDELTNIKTVDSRKASEEASQ